MNPLVILGVIVALALVIGFINYRPKSDKPSNIIRFRALLSGASQVPPVSSKGVGHATLKYDVCTRVFTLSVVYDGIVPNAAHIHRGDSGVNGAIVFPITAGPSPLRLTSRVLVDEEIALLKNGGYYINLHTIEHPEGEIRGQLLHS